MAGKRRRKSRVTDDRKANEAETSEDEEARINAELRASLIEEVDEDDLSEEDLATDEENGEEDQEEGDDNDSGESDDGNDEDDEIGDDMVDDVPTVHQRHYREPVAIAPTKYDVPTADEQRALRSADELLRSNLLVLQTKELLSEARALNPTLKSTKNNEDNSQDNSQENQDKNIKLIKKRDKESKALKTWLFEFRSFLLSLDTCKVSAESHIKTSPGLPLSAHGRAALATDQAHQNLNSSKSSSKSKSKSSSKSSSSSTTDSVGHEPPPSLDFKPPIKVDVVGGFMVGTLTKLSNHPCCVDVVMTMSRDSIGPRDHVNCRYLDKRHMFLGIIAQKLIEQSKQHKEDPKIDIKEQTNKKNKKSKLNQKEAANTSNTSNSLMKVKNGLFIEAQDGDIRNCSLLITPEGVAGKTFSIRLSVQLESSVIPAKRLLPDRGNLRRYWNWTSPPPPSTTPMAISEASSSSSSSTQKSDDASLLRSPTPCYNATVLSAMGEPQLYTRIIHGALNEEDGCPSMREAMILGRVWLNARKGSGCLGVDTLTDKQLDYLLVYLFKSRKAIGSQMAPLQVFTVFLNFLASGGLLKAPLTLPVMDDDDDDEDETNEWGYETGGVTSDELALFAKHYEVVLVEPSMRLNVLASVSACGAKELQREASSSVASLRISDGSGEDTLDAFQAVFLRRTPFSSRYDCYVTLPFRDPSSLLPRSCFDIQPQQRRDNNNNNSSSSVSVIEDKERRNVLDMPAGLRLLRKLPSLLKEALFDRVTHVEARVFFGTASNSHAIHNSAGKSNISNNNDDDNDRYQGRSHGWTKWPLHNIAPGGSQGIGGGGGTTSYGTMVLGINCEPTKANRIVDRGPAADDKIKANAFRAFWGDKSELRRFKDGSIVEAVLWNTDESTCGVIEQVCKYILKRHAPTYAIAKDPSMQLPNYAIPPNMNMSFVGSQIENYLLTPDFMSCVRTALDVFDELETRLKIISGSTKAIIKAHHKTFSRRAGSMNLPLKVDSVSCVSPHLRYTSLSPPTSITSPNNTNSGSDRTTRLSDPIEVLVRFERSNGWPDDIRALRAAKTAFLIQICRSLEDFSTDTNSQSSQNAPAKPKTTKTDIKCYPNHNFADIWLKGFVFRVRLLVEKEAGLITWPKSQSAGGKKYGSGEAKSFPILSRDPLTASGYGENTPKEMQKRALQHKHGHKNKISDQVEHMIKVWGAYAPIPERWHLRVSTFSLPQHHSMIHGLAVAQRAYSPSLRLVLRWLAAHRLSHQIPLPLVELLVAHAFFHGRGPCIAQTASDSSKKKNTSRGLGVAVEGIPSSALHGLHRFLLLLTTHDWEGSPLIVQPDPYEYSSPQMNGTDQKTQNQDGDGDEDDDNIGEGGKGGNKNKTIGLSGDDRRHIQHVFDSVRSLKPTLEQQQQVGHASASSMWVISPYDRIHGWLSSWGISHGNACGKSTGASVDHACFPGVGKKLIQTNEGSGSSSSSIEKSESVNHQNQDDNQFHGNSGFNGVEKAVLSRIQAAANQSILHLDQWIRYAAISGHHNSDVDDDELNQDELFEENLEKEASFWKQAFMSQDARFSLGANVKLHINSKVTYDASNSDTANTSNESSSSSSLNSSKKKNKQAILSGQELSNVISKGPPGLRMKTLYSNLQSANDLGRRLIQTSQESGDRKNNNNSDQIIHQQLVGMQPIEEVIEKLRNRFGHLALFFLDEFGTSLKSDVNNNDDANGVGIYLVWRPSVFVPNNFRFMESKLRIRIDTDTSHTIKTIQKNKNKNKNKMKNNDSDSDSDTEDEDEEVDVFAAPKKNNGKKSNNNKKAKMSSMVGVPDIIAITKEMIALSDGILERPCFL